MKGNKLKSILIIHLRYNYILRGSGPAYLSYRLYYRDDFSMSFSYILNSSVVLLGLFGRQKEIFQRPIYLLLSFGNSLDSYFPPGGHSTSFHLYHLKAFNYIRY